MNEIDAILLAETHLVVVGPIRFSIDSYGRSLETCDFWTMGTNFEAARFNGGRVEVYQLVDGAPRFCGYARPEAKRDAELISKFEDARRSRERAESEAYRPLELV